jgi:hypothetical protein
VFNIYWDPGDPGCPSGAFWAVNPSDPVWGGTVPCSGDGPFFSVCCDQNNIWHGNLWSAAATAVGTVTSTSPYTIRFDFGPTAFCDQTVTIVVTTP